ncbi:MAG: TatD family hydrolase [Clostridia bacterium]|nr:TatD family hydrolase [Clostridia bacterium]
MFFDTHTHLDDEKFENMRGELLAELPANGIAPIMAIAADRESCFSAVKLAEQHPFVLASVGQHPAAAQNMDEEQFAELAELAKHPRVKCIGEIGLDYHWPEDTDKEMQKYWFIRQMELADKLSLPVSIHSRDAMADTLEILRMFPRVTGVMHCYAGSYHTMNELVKMGYYIALGGVVTFKNARVSHEVAQYVPIDHLLIETDCPYLAPEPHRGHLNTPLYVPLVAEKIAALRHTDTEQIAKATRENGMRLFNITQKGEYEYE